MTLKERRRRSMAEAATRSVMRRMARLGRQEYTARAMSPAKALRLSLARTGDKLFDLPLTVNAIEQGDIAHADLPGEVGRGGLLALLDGALGEGGAMRLDPGLLTALVEMQTTGHVSGQSDASRRVTRTDAAMAAPMIDGTLERIDACMAAETREDWTSGYRFGVMMEDVRTLALSLTASDYTVFRVMLEIGKDAIPGALTMILPRLAATDPPVTAAEPDAPGREPGTTLACAVLEAPVTLQAMLGRITLPLDKLCTLKVGDRLPFARDRLLEARLEVAHKHLVAHARLGQMDGARAVRLGPRELQPAPSIHDPAATVRPAGAEGPPADAAPPDAGQALGQMATGTAVPGDAGRAGGAAAPVASEMQDLKLSTTTQGEG